MSRFVALMFLCTLAGCRHQPPRVDCDQRLEPINAPAAPVKAPASSKTAP